MEVLRYFLLLERLEYLCELGGIIDEHERQTEEGNKLMNPK